MKSTEMKSIASDMSPDDSKKNSKPSAGAARGRGRGRSSASGLGPTPGISKPRVNRPASDPTPENLETSSSLQNKKRFTDGIESFIEEGHLNKKFLRLLQTKATNPYFMGNLIHTFFNESEKLLNELTDAINNHSEIDLKKVDKLLNLLKIKCSRIGVQKVHDDCIGFINSPDGCRFRLSLLQMDYHVLKNFTFDLFFDKEKSYLNYGGTYPL